MSTATGPVYGVDLVTFFHPGFWGLETEDEVARWCAENPRALWDRMLDSVVAAGVEFVEITFPPLDHTSAVAAFGSAAAVRDAFAARGLRILSGFLDATGWDGLTPEEAAASVAGYVAFLRTVGATALVAGSPMEPHGAEPTPERAERLLRFAAAAEAAGRSMVGTGVRFAVHTESHSLTVTEEDVRTVMRATDPDLVGLCPDSAHLTLSGADPVAVAVEFADRVVISHWKDASGPFPDDLVVAPDEDVHAVHRRFMRPMGEGVVDWAGWARAMAGTPTAPVRLLELDAAADPVAELVSARAFAERL